MDGNLEIESGTGCPGAAVVDVTGKTLLAAIEVEGRKYFVATEAADVPAQADGLRLLPGFDEFLLGYRDRSSVLAPEHSQAIVPGGNGMFKATIVVGGEVVGTWGRSVGQRGVVVAAAPFSPLSGEALDELAGAAEHYGRFMGRPATVRLVASA